MTHTYKHQFPTEYNIRPQDTFSWNQDILLVLIFTCFIVVSIVTMIATWR